jgi:hypothetical protein
MGYKNKKIKQLYPVCTEQGYMYTPCGRVCKVNNYFKMSSSRKYSPQAMMRTAGKMK